MKYRFRTKPFPAQKKGLVKLWRKGGGAMFWDPGTGKTKTALDYASALHQSGKCRRVLVLCPINALQVWPAQAELHVPHDVWWEMIIPDGSIAQKSRQISEWTDYWEDNDEPLLFIVLNYEAIIKRDPKWGIMALLEYYDADLLICDESQKIKNATAKRSKATHRLGKKARHVVIMSGTPTSKNYLDLYSQIKAIDDKAWWDDEKKKVMSWTEIRYRYAIWGGRSGYELRGYRNMDDFFRRYKPYVTTARRSGNLPKVTHSIIPVVMSPSPRESYNIFAEEGLVVWRRHLIEAPIPLTKLLRLQQMCGGAVHDDVGEVAEFQLDKASVALDKWSELREAERKVVIFARFKWEMDYLASKTKEVLQIRGGISHRKRVEAVKMFQTKRVNTLIIQIGSAEAIDGLQRVCSDAIFYSTDYSWDHFSQAVGRLDRTGQKEPVVFHHIHVVNSVDKLVYRALNEKRNLERLIMDDPDLLLPSR